MLVACPFSIKLYLFITHKVCIETCVLSVFKTISSQPWYKCYSKAYPYPESHDIKCYPKDYPDWVSFAYPLDFPVLLTQGTSLVLFDPQRHTAQVKRVVTLSPHNWKKTISTINTSYTLYFFHLLVQCIDKS